jgi:hypothetical protein
MRINFTIDTTPLNAGWRRKTAIVDGHTFTLIGSGQSGHKSQRSYTLEGPGVHLHTDGHGVLRSTSFPTLDGAAPAASRVLPNEVTLGSNMEFHTAEVKAKKIIRRVLGL